MRILVIALLFIVLSGVLNSQTVHLDTIRLDEQHQRVAAGDYGGMIIDSLKDLKIEDLITEIGRDKFQPIHKSVPNFGIADQVYWFAFNVIRDTSSLDWTISINNPSCRRIDCYIVDSTGITQRFTLGSDIPYANRAIKNRFHILALPISRNIPYTVFLKIDGGDLGHYFPIDFESVPLTSERISNDSLFYGIYTGLMLFMGMLSLFFYFSVRERKFLFYSLSVFSTLFLNLSIDGWIFQFFFTKSPAPVTWSYLIMIILYQTFGILFARDYLKTVTLTPRLDKALIVLLVFAPLSPLTKFFGINIAVNATVASNFAQFIIVVWAGIIAIRKKHRPAWFYVIAMIENIGFAVCITLYYHGMMPHEFVYAGLVGTTLQVIILSVGLADEFYIERREKQEVQAQALKTQTELANAFARFVPREMLAFLGKEHIKDVALGDAVERPMTIMFSDIRAFTTISEQLTPQEVFVFLNNYLSQISPIIRRSNGFIDKYMGDAILAIFPESVESAIDCSIGMLQGLRQYNASSPVFDIPVSIGIGLHTGPTMLGTIGEDERFDTTVIADVVNLASRLEGLTKYYGNSLLVTGEIIGQVADKRKYQYRYIDHVLVVGSSRSVDVFEIFNADEPRQIAAKLETEPMLTRAIRHYQRGAYQESLAELETVLTLTPQDSVALLYKERNEHNIQFNTPAEAAAVTSFRQK